MQYPRYLRTCAVLIFLMLAAGCNSYNNKIGTAVQSYQVGQYTLAAQQCAQVAATAKERDRLLIQLENGSMNRAAGNAAVSVGAFDAAEASFTHYDNKAKSALAREAVVALTNPTYIHYEGYGYDRIMMNVYKSLAYLEMGQKDDARVEIRRVAQSQVRCEERYRNQIKQAQAAAQDLEKQNKRRVDTDKSMSDPRFKNSAKPILADFPEIDQERPLDDLSHKALYTNPFAEYLQGLFFLYSEFAGDAEVGRVALRNAAGMMMSNPYAVQDAKDAEEMAAGGAAKAKTYVVFETGMAPMREQIRIDLPIFVFNLAVNDTKVDYVGVAFPKLVKCQDYHQYLFVATLDGNYRSAVLADMDQIVAREFKHEMPKIIMRLIISAATKAAMQYAVAEATKSQDAFVQILARGSMAIYSAAMNEADLRTWRTLPKQVQIASMPTPQNGKLTLSGPGGQPLGTVTVPAGKANLVWVRCPSRGAIPAVKMFTLN